MRFSSLQLVATCCWTWLLVDPSAIAEASAETLAESRNLGVKVLVVLPESGTIVARETTERGHSVVVHIGRDEPAHGIIVQIRDMVDRALWTHDFGYNLSATPGCRITVDISERHHAALVHYDGYKWDHDHRLIFLGAPAAAGEAVRAIEYRDARRDILPHLQARPEFAGDAYWITPVRFIDEGVLFGCTPLQRREGAAHPFDQEAPGFTVRARLDRDAAIEPLTITQER